MAVKVTIDWAFCYMLSRIPHDERDTYVRCIGYLYEDAKELVPVEKMRLAKISRGLADVRVDSVIIT